MTKPKKQVVDYFPHYVHHGETIEALTFKHKEVGKNFWFSILELLSKKDGHALDLSTDDKWQRMLRYCFVDEVVGNELMQILIDESAIDKALWSEYKIIWCQNFVDNLEPLYSRRKCELPQKPKFKRKKNPAQRVVTGNERVVTPPKSLKVKESKAKKSKVLKEAVSRLRQSILDNNYFNGLQNDLQFDYWLVSTTKLFPKIDYIKELPDCENFHLAEKDPTIFRMQKMIRNWFKNVGNDFTNSNGKSHKHGDTKPTKDGDDWHFCLHWWHPDKVFDKDEKLVDFDKPGEWINYDYWQNYCSNELKGIGFYNQDGTQRTKRWKE